MEKSHHKIGLILEGGGMRGIFSAGVMDVLMENNISFDGIIGVSAGACFGCNYKSLQRGRVLRYNLNYAKNPQFMGLRCLLKEGNFVGAEFAYHKLPTELDPFDNETFKKNPTEFYIVCCDIESGEAIYHRIDDMDYTNLEWLRASASMPLVSVPVELEGRKLLDGGMVDSIPLKAFHDMGYKKNIVILTQHWSFYKKPTKLTPIFKTFMSKYPKVAQLMKNRHIMYNNQLDYIKRCKSEGTTLIISPQEPLNINRTSSNFKRMNRVYQMGRDTAKSELESILKFMNS